MINRDIEDKLISYFRVQLWHRLERQAIIYSPSHASTLASRYISDDDAEEDRRDGEAVRSAETRAVERRIQSLTKSKNHRQHDIAVQRAAVHSSVNDCLDELSNMKISIEARNNRNIRRRMGLPAPASGREEVVRKKRRRKILEVVQVIAPTPPAPPSPAYSPPFLRSSVKKQVNKRRGRQSTW